MSALPKRSTTAIVLDAVEELHANEKIVLRETLSEFTNLKLTIIDDRIGVLIEEGLVLRVGRGVFVPAPQFPPARAISQTSLPDGWYKIEVGDHVLTLTPREKRMLGVMLAGAAAEATAIEAGHHANVLAAELAERNRKLERRVHALEGKQPQGQLQLIGLEPVELLGGLKT